MLATGILNPANPGVHLPCRNMWRAAVFDLGSEVPVGPRAMAPCQGTHSGAGATPELWTVEGSSRR